MNISTMKLQSACTLAFLAVSLTIVGCGGGDDISRTSILDIGGKAISVSADVRWDRFPAVELPGVHLSCNNLITAGEFSASVPPFPSGFEAMSVTIYRGATPISSAQVSTAENQTRPDGRLLVIARTCAPSGLQQGETLQAVFTVRFGHQQFDLAAPAGELTLSF